MGWCERIEQMAKTFLNPLPHDHDHDHDRNIFRMQANVSHAGESVVLAGSIRFLVGVDVMPLTINNDVCQRLFFLRQNRFIDPNLTQTCLISLLSCFCTDRRILCFSEAVLFSKGMEMDQIRKGGSAAAISSLLLSLDSQRKLCQGHSPFFILHSSFPSFFILTFCFLERLLVLDCLLTSPRSSFCFLNPLAFRSIQQSMITSFSFL